MVSILSSDNSIVKNAAKLAAKKYRDELACYIAEGPNLIREAMQQGIELRSLFFLDDSSMPDSRVEELNKLKAKASEMNIATYSLRAEAFLKIAQTDNPQGVLAVVKKKSYSKETFFYDPMGNVLVLDRVQDPGNIGTLLRTAEAAGFSGAMLLKGCGDVYAPKTVRAAAGTLFRLPLLFVATPLEAADILHKNQKCIYATAADAEKFYFDVPLATNAAVVLGNEGNGISAELLQQADRLIGIPMGGRTESLNVALAGGIIMYEAFRQRLSEQF
ncbi:MAG: RNA methyltransferase [Clostridia bacterium]|nr:RNA methyltransferase [Clostridia bacterium]